MTLRLLPWSPEYGSGIEADADPLDEGATPDIDIYAEKRPWEPVWPMGSPPRAVQIVDGVRRVEAHAIDDLGDGNIAFGVFGSYAAGAVRCEGSSARILDGERELVVGRRYLQSGGAPAGVNIATSTAHLSFEATVPRGATTPTKLVDALLQRMREEEARLADALSTDSGALTITDGPLRGHPSGGRVVGYVKRIQNWYLDPPQLALLSELAVGERTPLFRIAGGGEAGSRGQRDRYGWYMRIADMGAQFHHLACIVRLEAPGDLPPPDAARLADECALALPRLASSPIRDARAPQNLTPVGALEDTLRRRLGDREWVRRLIASALSTAPLPAKDGQEGDRW